MPSNLGPFGIRPWTRPNFLNLYSRKVLLTVLLVIGGTGQIGSHFSSSVRDRHDVRAIAHTLKSQGKLSALGFDVVAGSIDDPGTLARALDGVDRLFLATPNHERLAEREIAVIEAAECAGVRRLAKISVVFAGEPMILTAPHGLVEQRLQSSSLEWVALQPVAFMDNVLGQLDGVAQGAFYFAAGVAHIPLIDTRDIADAALAFLDGSTDERGSVVVTGPQSITLSEFADRLGASVSRPVAYVDPGPEGWRGALLGAGLPEWYADGLVELFSRYTSAGDTPATGGVQRLTGQPARTVEAFADEVLTPALAALR